jgi:phage terminase Nu1 subunit (DNA packaging protein)
MAHLSKADAQARVSANEAARRKSVAMAEYRELETAKFKGALIDRADAIREWSQACGRLRDRLVAIPDRVAATLEGKPESQIRSKLRSEIEDALRSLAS